MKNLYTYTHILVHTLSHGLVLALGMGVGHLVGGLLCPARPRQRVPRTERNSWAFMGDAELILGSKRRGWRGSLGLINTEV